MLWNFKTPTAFELDWPLIDSPVPVVLILLTYAFFVFKYGKIFMQNRQPYNVKNIMLVYNAVQVVYNLIMFLVSANFLLFSSIYDLRCIERLPLEHPVKFLENCISYGYFINKILDLADTIFFVLRKSFKQITPLHVYHHIGMVTAGYAILRFYGTGGHPCMTGLLNTFVHVFMYAYYFLSALSTRVRSALWWKRYITILQMLQFVIILLYSTYVLIFAKDCVYSPTFLWVSITQSGLMLLMFVNFYVKTYIQPKKVQHGQKKSESNVKQE